MASGMNILSFDLEEWYQLAQRRLTGELPPARDTILRQTHLLLELLERHQTNATFFVLGMVAERYPELVRQIAAQGHEIASHGYAHLRVCELSREQFESDTRRSRDLLQGIIGKPIRGYRAPEFSINARTLWALDILAGLGFSYDSSIYPIHHRRYGIPGFPPAPGNYQLGSGLQITELPLATFSFAGIRAPVAGGGYFRVLPHWALRRAVFQHEARHQPMITYFHPYEFDSSPLDVFETISANGWQRKMSGRHLNWQSNLGRASVRSKISALLGKHKFTTCEEYLDAARLTQDRTLLPATSASV
jgi:polysaccharide deacetylase family protein (PEP-CTERM system associated)